MTSVEMPGLSSPECSWRCPVSLSTGVARASTGESYGGLSES